MAEVLACSTNNNHHNTVTHIPITQDNYRQGSRQQGYQGDRKMGDLRNQGHFDSRRLQGQQHEPRRQGPYSDRYGSDQNNGNRRGGQDNRDH